MNTLPYISAVVAFSAAWIAIVGKPKWDPSKRGLRQLTPTGRLAGILALLALASTIAMTWSAQRATDAQRVQRDKIRKLAHTELRLELQELAHPFVGLLGRARHQMQMDPSGPIRTSGKIFPACMLDRTDYALIAEETDPQRRVKKGAVVTDNFIRKEWDESRGARYEATRFAIKREATSAAAAIDRILATYAAYLEPQILYSVAELRRSRWLWQLQHFGDKSIVLQSGILDDGPFPAGDDFGYQHFWRVVERLWNESDGLFRNSENKELWGPDHPVMMRLRGGGVRGGR